MESDSESSLSETRGEWVIGLCEVGDPASFLLSYTCSPCALAYARTNLDDSSCIFNLMCLPICCLPVSRWLMRTAYDIEAAQGSEAVDCLQSTFLPCCVVNQMFQTSAQYGNTSHGGGYFSNVRDFHLTLGTCKDELGDVDSCCDTSCAINYVGNTSLCMYSFLCCPCAISEVMDLSMGMPTFYGCFCITPCAARNLVRYHFRVHGDDLLQEVCMPAVASLALWAGTTSILAPIPVMGLMLPEVYAEAKLRGKTNIRKYLTYGGHEAFVPYESYNTTAYSPEEEFLLNSRSRDDATLNSEVDAKSHASADGSFSALSKASLGANTDTREVGQSQGSKKDRKNSNTKGLGDLAQGQPAPHGRGKLKRRHLPRAGRVMLAQQWDRDIPTAETNYEIRQPVYRPREGELAGEACAEKALEGPGSGTAHEAAPLPPGS